MTEQETREAAAKQIGAYLKLGKTTIEDIQDAARQASEDTSLPSVILDSILDILQDNMETDAFVRFCDEEL